MIDQDLSMLQAVSVILDLQEEIRQVEVDVLYQSPVFLFNTCLYSLVVCLEIIVSCWELRQVVFEVIVSEF